MNENAFKGYSAGDDHIADEDNLFDDLERIERNQESASDASLLHAETPRLSLVRPEEAEDVIDEADGSPLPQEVTDALSATEDGVLDEDYGELWLAGAEGDDPLSSELRRSLTHSESDFAMSESFDLDHELHGLDHSAVEDVVVTNPLQDAVADLAEDAAETEPVASSTVLASASMPRERGKAAKAKLTWKPGDPFGGSGEMLDRFRWELMLTTACITAVCGMGGIWLLRTILA